MGMERLTVLAAGTALALTACGSPEAAAPEDPSVPMAAAQEGDIEPVDVEQAVNVTVEDEAGFFVVDRTCTYTESKEEMGAWLQARLDKLKAQGIEGEELLEGVSRLWRRAEVDHAEAYPERARNELEGVETFLGPIADVMRQAGEWNLETDADVVATTTALVKRARIDTAGGSADVSNTSCDPETGEVTPTGDTKHISEDMLIVVFSAKVINEGTAEEAIAIADAEDPDKIYTAETGCDVEIIDGKVLMAAVICGNLNFEGDCVPPAKPVTPEGDIPDGDIPDEDLDKNIDRSSKGSTGVRTEPNVGVEDDGTQTEEPRGAQEHEEGSDNNEDGLTDHTRDEDQVRVKNDDEDADNGDVSKEGGADDEDAEVDDSEKTVDQDDPGVDGAKPVGTPN